MKKIALTLVTVLIVVTSVLATEEVKSEVLEAFNAKFPGAKEVSWSSGRNYYKATFIFYGTHMVAWYEMSGKSLWLRKFAAITNILYLFISIEPMINPFASYESMEDAMKSKNGQRSYCCSDAWCQSIFTWYHLYIQEYKPKYR